MVNEIDNNKNVINKEDNICNLDNNTILYKVIENGDGELVYELDFNGNRIELCKLSDIEFEERKIYTSKDWMKDFNKLLKENKIINNSKDLIDLLNIDEKYCCIQRMGETPSNENDKLVGINEEQIAWFNIASLQLFKNNIIKDTTIVKDSIRKTKIENITSIKNIPITKNDIMVSFKLTVGVSKLYLSNNYAVCNEAIDILTPCNNTYNYYLNFIIGDLYLKNVGNNSLQGGTLNDDIKKSISIKFPKSSINKLTQENISSLELQKSIAFLLENKLNKIDSKKETLSSMKLLLKQKKESILENVFCDNMKESELKDVVLYKVIENDDGGLVYCDKDGNKLDKDNYVDENNKDKRITLCKLGVVEFEERKDPFLEKSKNKTIFTKEIKEINKLGIGRGEFVPKEEYILNGEYPLYTSSKEKAGNYDKYNFGIKNKYSITFPTDNIPTFNINYGYAWAGNVCAFIENYTLDIDTKYLYYYLHNEKRNHNNNYMNKFSLEYLQNNYKIFVPKERQDNISSLELQKSIAFYIEQEFKKIEEQMETIDSMVLLLGVAKEEILNEVFKGK